MIAYLFPKSPFAKAVPRSDTLFGAIAWAIRLLYGNDALEILLSDFDEAEEEKISPPFILSSLFPFVEDKASRLHFFPRPLIAPAFHLTNSLSEYQQFKRIKKTRFVSEKIFNHILSGELNEDDTMKSTMTANADVQISAGALCAKDESQRLQYVQSLIHEGEIARNSINRLSNSTADVGGQLFHQSFAGATSLGSRYSAGFFLLFRFGGSKPEETSKMVQAALTFLGDKGIGGDSSVGHGHYSAEFSDALPFNEPNEGGRMMTLSLLYPSESDSEHLRLNKETTFARIERRKGFVESAFAQETERIWKPTLFMLTEGSTFVRDGERGVYGNLFTDNSERKGLPYKLRINGLGFTVRISEK